MGEHELPYLLTYLLTYKLSDKSQTKAAVAGNPDRTTLSAIAVHGVQLQHADDGYSTRENFGSSLARSMFLIYSPYGRNRYALNH